MTESANRGVFRDLNPSNVTPQLSTRLPKYPNPTLPDPRAGNTGGMLFDTTDDIARYSNGTAWVSFANGGSETLTSAGAIDPELSVTEICDNTTFDLGQGLPVYTLADGVEGQVKTIRIFPGCGNVRVVTSQGAFNLTFINPSAQLVFSNGLWNFVGSPPWYVTVQQGSKLVGTGAVGASSQGLPIVLSADGNTLAIGGPTDNSSAGAVWVFTRDSDGNWTQQGNKLVGTGAVGSAGQGLGIALSADGNTLAFGGEADNGDAGAAWVFTRTAGVWSQQGSKLVGTGATGNANQGLDVALSADGNTLAVGGRADDTGIGATWVFTRTAGVWSQQGSKLVGTGNVGASVQGIAVALSADGNTLAVGGEGDDTLAGAVWVFTRTGSTWTQQGAKLTGSDAVTPSEQGQFVSLSADGNTLAVGGPSDDTATGAAWIYTRSNGVWTQQGSKLVGTGATGAAGQGAGVSLSKIGDTLAVGGEFDNSSVGAVWIYTRENDVWTQQGSKLVGTGATGTSRQSIVAFDWEGKTLAVGGFGDNGGLGAAWVYV